MIENDDAAPGPPTTVERTSGCEVVATCTIDAPARRVFEAWTDPELFRRWWAPRSLGVTIVSCTLDVRTGGTYRLEMSHLSSAHPMTFFGRYVEVIPNARISWTNDEAGEAGAVTTVTFEERSGRTLVVVRDRYPSQQALDEAIACGSTSGWSAQFVQLNGLMRDLGGDGGAIPADIGG